MSSDSSDTDCSTQTDDSEYNFLPGYIPNFQHIEVENPCSDADDQVVQVQDGIEPYAYEPLADEEWTQQYELRQAERQKRLESLNDRLAGIEAVDKWCSCGNCSTEVLQNPNECYCCQDLQQCLDELASELVKKEVGQEPTCITQHPGFATVCLNKWSLRLSAGKYRRLDKKSYTQKDSEAAFFRSIAYREFVQLVYGRLGKVRIPLPACAYHVIRKTFLPENTTDSFVGFQEEP